MSIPKIIHYCWFGGGSISAESQKCMESWKKYCPDYKIIEWNEQNFDISTNRYAQQAYEAKKYAFVSDYVRLAVLYEYGGIYLDTDVELVRPLDELLEYKGFIGMERSAPSPYGRTLLVNTGSGVGAEPGCEMIGKMLAGYRNAAFIQETGEPDLRACTGRSAPLASTTTTAAGRRAIRQAVCASASSVPKSGAGVCGCGSARPASCGKHGAACATAAACNGKGGSSAGDCSSGRASCWISR